MTVMQTQTADGEKGTHNATLFQSKRYPMTQPSSFFSLDLHPLLDARVFVTEFPRPMGAMQSSPNLLHLLSVDTTAPLQTDDSVKSAVRGLLRQGGFKPTGRNKPASEYLIKAARDGSLSSINVAVDACNAASLHSGLPISVVDLDRAREPFRVAVATAGSEYVFNPSGQTIQLNGLLCLFDADGPCGNAVKDSQRTKTRDETRRTLTIIWGTTDLPGRAAETERWYHTLLQENGAMVTEVHPS
jgi:DNA/RNA-binding domain of Phe-tRNA-synthetase-like protein